MKLNCILSYALQDDLAAAFRKFDSNEDGVLSYDEFAVAVVNMGLGITKASDSG